MEDAPTGPLVRQDSPAGSGRTGSSDTEDGPPASSQRVGGRRYRTGRPPPQRRRAGERPRADTAPFPSGFGARATLGVLLGWCVACCLLASWVHLTVVAGLGFCAGSALAAWYCRPTALLRMVTAVPAVFAVAEILAQLATLGGRRHAIAVSVAGGTLLTLAEVAPWLFGGTAAAVTIAIFRGLPQCVRDLRADLRGSAPARGQRSGSRGPPAEQAPRVHPPRGRSPGASRPDGP